MSTVLALGGAGTMGRPAVRTLLANRSDLDRLVRADADGERARAVVAGIEDPRVEARSFDITDGAALAEALGAADLALNTVGPFYEFGATVLAACVDAGVDYVDICDDPAPTEAMLAIDGPAQAAGVTAVVGFGASPGVSNLLATYAAGRLDEVEEVLTAWFTGAGGGGDDPPAAAVHGLHVVADRVPTYRNGERIRVAPFDESRTARFRGSASTSCSMWAIPNR